jgi:hypothetical protein
MILMPTNSLLRPLEGVGPQIMAFFRAQWHWLCSLQFQGPKKSQFQGAPLTMALVMNIACIKIIMSRTSGTFIVIIDVPCTQELWWCLVGLLQREAWPI